MRLLEWELIISVSKCSSTWGNKSRKIFIRCPKGWEGGGEAIDSPFKLIYHEESELRVFGKEQSSLPGGKCQEKVGFWVFAFASGAAPAFLTVPAAHPRVLLKQRRCSPDLTFDYLEIVWLPISLDHGPLTLDWLIGG